jgi:hypothetical protein
VSRLRSPSQSVRNPTTWFQLGIIGYAGPEIANGLGAFLRVARFEPRFGRAFSPGVGSLSTGFLSAAISGRDLTRRHVDDAAIQISDTLALSIVGVDMENARHVRHVVLVVVGLHLGREASKR